MHCRSALVKTHLSDPDIEAKTHHIIAEAAPLINGTDAVKAINVPTSSIWVETANCGLVR